MKRIILIISILILALCTKTSAASVSLGVSSNKSTVNPGDTFTVTISLGGQMGAATVNLAFNNNLFDYVSATGGTVNNLGSTIRIVYFDATGGSSPISGISVTFRAKAIGTGSFTASGNGFANADASDTYSPINSGSTSVKIEEKVVTPPPQTTTPETPPQNNTQTPAPTPETSNNNNNATQNTASSNAYLKSLRLNKEGISPTFKKATLNYSIVVDNSTTKLEVTAVPEDANAKVSITGNTGFKQGNNKISIVVTAPDNKTKKTYIINVSKTNNPELANANLENLAIENEILMPEFSAENTDYNIQVGSGVDKLNILAVPQKQGASVVISGNENLEFGENTITITVNAEDKITVKDYIIKVYKKTVEEENAIEKEMEEDEAIVLDSNEIIKEVKKTNWIIIIGGIFIVGALGVGGYVYYIKKIKK